MMKSVEVNPCNMSSWLEDRTSDVFGRDFPVNPSRGTAAPPDSSGYQNACARRDISRVSREELEDRFLRVHEETLQLKQHIHKQDDKIKKLGTKLMRLVKDRGRMEQLATGRVNQPSRLRDIETEEMMEELQDKVRGLQNENEGLKQRLLVAKQQLINSQTRRPLAYQHVQSRVNSGQSRLPEDTSSPFQAQRRSTRSLDGGDRPPTGQLPRYGHNLLEEARAKIRNLENVIESQQSHVEELEEASERLREELEKNHADYEERILQVQQQHTSSLKSQVNSNVSMIKLQKQLADRSNAVTELEGRFLQLQEAQQTLKASHDAAMAKVDELSTQLKDERMKGLEQENRRQSANITKIQVEQLQERIAELEQERDLLTDSNKKLLDSAFEASQQQKWQLREQQLKLQIAQLETALKADLVDKNEILDRIKDEREKNEQLTEENKKIQLQLLEQRQQLEELKDRLKFYSRENDYNVAELTEALLLIKKRKSQEIRDQGLMEEADNSQESSVRELRAAHAETIQELEKTRNLLNMESQISRDYKAELETALQKMTSDKVECEHKLERQAQLLDKRAAKITKLEAQLRDIAYGTKAYVFKPNLTSENDADMFDETLHLENGENLLELHIVGVTLSPPALQALGDADPSTFCTYSFYLFELHSTPVVKGHNPKYGYTSKYVVSMDEQFLDYLHRCSVTVELHQALGLDWRTLATGQLRLQQLLDQDGTVHGSIPLVGTHEDVRSFGSLDYWLRLKINMSESVWLCREKVKAASFIHSAPSKQVQPASSSSWNELSITVQRCSDLRSSCSQLPSPYVVYTFFSFADYPTNTVHDQRNPEFHDLRSFSVLMDQGLDQYLKSEELCFYVFDYKEEKMDTYLGKARVSLLSLTHDQVITGVFELHDPSGVPAGYIEVTLRWKFTYLPPPESIVTVEEPRFPPEEKPGKGSTDGAEDQLHMEKQKSDTQLKAVKEMTQDNGDRYLRRSEAAAAAKAPLPKLREQRTQEKDGPASKRVTFVESAFADDQMASEAPASPTEEEEDESHVSEGQLVPSAQSYSDDSDISEEIVQDMEDVRPASSSHRESTHSDSDDCIVHRQDTGRKPSERIRVEVVSLSLRPQSWLAQDDSVVRLFVEYSFLDLPTEETPVSLPKPPQGRSINYNYSKVIPVDAENNAARRQLLKEVLEGRKSQMERIRFTLVSEPPEEEEQERECEDVGVAFLRIPEILEKQQDLTEASLSVLDVGDGGEVLGTLTVSVEGLDALQGIMEDSGHE